MILNIEALRAIAALAVLLFHLNPLLERIGLSGLGGGGVDLFFVISGFIMTYIARQRSMGAAEFLLNRLLRIVPLYWLITLSVFILGLALPMLFKTMHGDLNQLVASLMFVPIIEDNRIINPVLFLGWTLNYEMIFYVLFASSLWISNHLIRSMALVSVLIAVVIIRSTTLPLPPLLNFYGNPIVLEFAFGIMLAHWVELAPSQSSLGAKLGLLIVGFAALVACLCPSPQLRDTYRVAVTGLPALIVVGSALVLDRWQWRINQPLIIALGKASYALYLTHIFVTEAAIHYVRMTGSDPVHIAAVIVASVSLSIIISLAISTRFEPRLKALVQASFKPTPRTTSAH